jgi:hypothetical protein
MSRNHPFDEYALFNTAITIDYHARLTIFDTALPVSQIVARTLGRIIDSLRWQQILWRFLNSQSIDFMMPIYGGAGWS